MNQEHYWTSPIKSTFKWNVEKRDFNGNLLDKKEFEHKGAAENFLEEKNYYINGVLTHSTI